MNAPLEGKLALLTGSSRGIGAAIARRLAAEGATVLVHYGSAPMRLFVKLNRRGVTPRPSAPTSRARTDPQR